MSFAQQKQRQYTQLAQTIQYISNELNVSRDLMGEMARQMQAMGKFGALHAAQMMAVETVETHIEETGRLPFAPNPDEASRMDVSDAEDQTSLVLADRDESTK